MTSFSLADTQLIWKDHSLTVFYQDHEIATMEFDPDATVRWIWVDAPYRRQGAASMMIAALERRTGLIAHALPPVSPLAKTLFR